MGLRSQKNERERIDDMVDRKVKGLGLDALFNGIEKNDRGSVTPPVNVSSRTSILRGKNITGVYVNGETVELVIAKRHVNGLTVTDAVREPITRRSLEEEHSKAASRTLAGIVAKKDLKRNILITALPSNMAILRRINVASSNRDEIEAVADHEAGSIPFSENDMEIRISVVAGDANWSSVLIAAVRRSAIEKHMSLFNAAGLRPDIVTLDSFALYNLFRQTRHVPGSVLQIEIGTGSTVMNIIEEGMLVFSRSFPTELARLKVPGTKEERPREIDDLIREIKLSLADFRTREVRLNVDSIALNDQGWKIDGLPDLLTTELGLRTERSDRVSDLPFSLTNKAAEVMDGPQRPSSTTMGLILQDPEAGDVCINLAPEAQPNIMFRKKKLLAVAAVLVLTVLTGAWVYGRFRSRQDKIAALDSRIAKLEPLASEVRQMADQTEMVKNYTSQENSFLDIIRELSLITASDTTVTRLDFAKHDSMLIEGYTASHGAATEFSRDLMASDLIQECRLRHSRNVLKKQKNVVEFQLLCKLRGPR